MPNNRIFVFSDVDDPEKALEIRNFLKEIRILNIIMVDLDYIFKLLTCSGDDDDGSNMPLEGLNAALKNSFKLPVIFYGGNADKANFLVELLDLGKRTDIGWIKNPYNYKSLFVIVEKIKFGFV